ncbi:MAG: chemotaxis protein CheC [Betaproteobacteria bacterium]|nr:chemotaxis protein CheC [Betaproteobacteria bacterium]
MRLSAEEQDATVELANIGISRAARQLSVLLDDEIRIGTPDVALCENVDEVVTALSHRPEEEVACVYQRLSGELTGQVVLLLAPRDTHALFHNLLGDGVMLHGIDVRAFEHEAMTELGNIIISSCVSAMADMLRQRIDVSIPRYSEARLDDLIEDGMGASRAVLLIQAPLQAAQREVDGVIALIFSASVAHQVLAAVRRITAS